jgi:hypothetical protein
MAKPKKTDTVLEIQAIEMRHIVFNVCGASPMIMNRFSQKAWRELLFPSGRKSTAELEQSLKHDPIAEFRGAVYMNRDNKRPTAIHVPNGAFHGALASAALDIPGAAKAKIERLTRVVDVTIDLFGLPQVFCAMVRNSDMSRTPDVRTRPIFPRWACRVSVSYVRAVLSERTIANLFGAAGLIVGIGDWRGQKGGPFGSFRLCGDGDAEFTNIVKTEGRAAQLKALEQPIFYDDDTRELLTWFETEVARREKDVPSSANGSKKGRRAPSVPVITEGRDGQYTGVENEAL